ncbi:unnamed protein product, partial [Ectocarpus sp. 12 AP-2014]
PPRWSDACRLHLYMVAGRWLTRVAWHVAWSVLLSCCWCCHCFAIHTASRATCSPWLQHGSSSSSSSLNVGMTGHAPRSRRDRGACCCSQHGSSGVRRAREAVKMGVEGVPGTTASAPAGAALVLSRPIDEVVLPPGRGLRVHSLSDLHTDSKDNLAWVKSWESWKGDEDGDLGEGHEDVLIVAGDISSSLERSAETLECLMERYDEVFFVVGNHEMWTGRRRPEGGVDSVEKLVQMHVLCESLGVRTDPVIFAVGGEGKSGVAAERGTTSEEKRGAMGGRQELAVFPLLSWYHASWDDEPNLPPELQLRRGDFLRRWRDYSYCHWPEDLCSREASM